MSEENALSKFDRILTEKVTQVKNYVSSLAEATDSIIKKIEGEISGDYYKGDKGDHMLTLSQELRVNRVKLEIGKHFLTIMKELEEQFPANLIEEQTRFEGVVSKLEKIQEAIDRVNVSLQVEGSGDVDPDDRYWRVWDTEMAIASYLNDAEAQHIRQYGDIKRYQFTEVTKEAYASFWYKHDQDIEALVSETEVEDLYSTLRSQIEDFKERKKAKAQDEEFVK